MVQKVFNVLVHELWEAVPPEEGAVVHCQLHGFQVGISVDRTGNIVVHVSCASDDEFVRVADPQCGRAPAECALLGKPRPPVPMDMALHVSGQIEHGQKRVVLKRAGLIRVDGNCNRRGHNFPGLTVTQLELGHVRRRALGGHGKAQCDDRILVKRHSTPHRCGIFHAPLNSDFGRQVRLPIIACLCFDLEETHFTSPRDPDRRLGFPSKSSRGDVQGQNWFLEVSIYDSDWPLALNVVKLDPVHGRPGNNATNPVEGEDGSLSRSHNFHVRLAPGLGLQVQGPILMGSQKALLQLVAVGVIRIKLDPMSTVQVCIALRRFIRRYPLDRNFAVQRATGEKPTDTIG
mmetsp:Transcript_31689/g.92062  ORF Transcript_31689/g.92062 Transcript_31689/m.92062 type:complete len:346 (+) Transcript_31689:214-1251(+)